MPIKNGKYENPNWKNGAAPYINAAELNDISGTLQNLDKKVPELETGLSTLDKDVFKKSEADKPNGVAMLDANNQLKPERLPDYGSFTAYSVNSNTPTITIENRRYYHDITYTIENNTLTINVSSSCKMAHGFIYLGKGSKIALKIAGNAAKSVAGDDFTTPNSEDSVVLWEFSILKDSIVFAKRGKIVPQN